MFDNAKGISRRAIVAWLVAMSFLAFAARTATVVYQKAWQHPNAMEHRSIAISLVNGWGFSFGDFGYYGPSSVQSPPFPFLLAAMFKIFGVDTPTDGSLHGANLAYFAIMVINAVAGAALVWLTYLLARTLGATVLAALLAAAAVAVWPSQVYAARHVQAISLITCSVAAMIILFYRAVRTANLKAWIGYCVVATLATLTEPVFLPALAISGLLVLFWPGLPWNIRLRNAFVLLLTTFIVIGPWTLRNRIVHEKWVPIKATFWVNVWKGNNDYATGTDRTAMSDEVKVRLGAVANQLDDSQVMESRYDGQRQYVMLDPSQQSRLRNQPEVIREEVFKELAMGWIEQHPVRYLELCGIRLFKTLTIDWDNPKAENIFYQISRFVLLGLSSAGLLLAFRQKWSLVFPAVLVVTALGTYTLTVTAARFSIPFEPLQLCLAAAVVAVFVQRRSPQPQETSRLGWVPAGSHQ
jgi:4-amino-4-deoxy-L-arabinose transferase-like glycosyltransferase